MKKRINPSWVLVTVATLTVFVAGPVFADSCKEEIPLVKASIDAMEADDTAFGDKQIAEKHLESAQGRLAEDDERGCLLYIEAARSTIQAAQNPR